MPNGDHEVGSDLLAPEADAVARAKAEEWLAPFLYRLLEEDVEMLLGIKAEAFRLDMVGGDVADEVFALHQQAYNERAKAFDRRIAHGNGPDGNVSD